MARQRMDIRKFGDILRPVVGGQGNQVENMDMEVEAPTASIPYSKGRGAQAFQGTKTGDRIEAANLSSGTFESKATTADDYSYIDANTGETINIAGLKDMDGNELQAFKPDLTASADQMRTNNQVKVVNSYGDEVNAYYVDVQAQDETGRIYNLKKKMYRNVDEFYGDENALKEAGYNTLKKNYMKFGFTESEAQKLTDQARLLKNDKSKTFNKGLSNFQIKRLQAEGLTKAFEWQKDGGNDTLRLSTEDPKTVLRKSTDQADIKLNFKYKNADGKTKTGHDFLNTEVGLKGLNSQNLSDVHLTDVDSGNITSIIDDAKKTFTKNNPDKVLEGNKGFDIFTGALVTQEDSEVKSSITDAEAFISTKNNVLVLATYNKHNIEEVIAEGNGELATKILIDMGFLRPEALGYENESQKQAIDASSVEFLKKISPKLSEYNEEIKNQMADGEYEKVLEGYTSWYNASAKVLRDAERKKDNLITNFNAENGDYFTKLNNMDKEGRFFKPGYEETETGQLVGKVYNSPQELVGTLDKKYGSNPIQYLAQVQSLLDAGVITDDAAAMLGTRARYLEVRLGDMVPEINRLRRKLGLQTGMVNVEEAEAEASTGLSFKGQSYNINTSFNKKTGKYDPYASTGEANPKFAQKLNFGMSVNKVYINHQDVLDDRFPGEGKIKTAEIIINRANGNEDDVLYLKKTFNITDEDYDALNIKDMTPAELVEIMDAARENVNNTKRVGPAIKKVVKGVIKKAKEKAQDPIGIRRGTDVIKKGLAERARVKEETGKTPIIPGRRPGGNIDYMRDLFKRRSN